MAYERKCIVCPDKHHYKYCSKCGEFNSLETWRYTFCSENCKDIYNICEDFENNRIDALAAQDKLKSLDLSDREFYLAPLKKNLDSIYAVKPKKKTVNKVEENVSFTTSTKDNIQTVTKDNVQTTKKRKRSYVRKTTSI